jgi:hypothetical protein
MLEVLIGEESDDSDFEVEKHKGRPNKIITRKKRECVKISPEIPL